jgi:branched-subunit amino acid ABC-type transport system permease component
MDFLQCTLDGLLEAGPYALVGLGLTLGFGLLRRVNLAYGASAMLGAYAGSWLHVRLDWPVWAVLPTVVLVTALAGLYVQWLCFAHSDRAIASAQRASPPVSGADAREVVALASSFAVWMQLEQLCVNLLPRHLNPFPDVASTHEWTLGTLGLRPDRLVMCIAALGLVVWVARWIHTSRTGLALRAAADHPLAAHLSGLRVPLLQRWGFVLASGLSGVAACAVLTLEGQVTPMFGMWMLMKGLAAAMIGGLGSLRGLLWGAALLGVAEAHAQALFGPLGRDAVTWGLLLLALLLRSTRQTSWAPAGGLHA